jgi:DNA helicase-2/ATP-dependent DNA helicase PcrA
MTKNDAFLQLLQGLNDAQRRAVDRIEGPVLVVAGPGTGKTHILAARVGKILLETDARPQNILCLTFTDAGVSAMRARLLDMIGPDAYRVPVFTFHSFCNRIIQENLEYFGKDRLEPVSDLERIEIVRELLAGLPPEHPLRDGKKNPFQYENHLRDLFATMKKEGWAPGLVLKMTDTFLHQLPEHPQFIYQKNTKHAKKGDLKTAQIEETSARMNRLKAAADLYPKYLHAMERAGRYEYEDMILWVQRAFEKNEALLRNYQERYLYIQVDEFQDTNGAQYHLLQQLLHFWEAPNAFIVGDDDQSIFEFQGARLDNLRHFHQHYRADLATIVLEENYRSGQEILDPAARLIERNLLRAVRLLDEPIQKTLRAAHPAAGQSRIRLCSYENRMQELAGMITQIQTLLREGVPPGEIAVIYARHKQANRLMTLLEKTGIPYQTRRPVNILDLPLVQQLRELLCYLNDEARRPYSGEHRLFRLLHAGFFGIDPADLAKIAVALHSSSPAPARYEPAGSAHRQAGGAWRNALCDPGFLQTLNLKKPEAPEPVSRHLDAWIAAVYNLPLPHLLERLYTQAGLLRWALDQPGKHRHVQALRTFSDFVEAETTRQPRFFAPRHSGGEAGLARFLNLLDSMDDNRLPLPLQQPVLQEQGVQLLTAHGAKGLEFEYVFLFDCTEEVWERNAGGNRGRFALPPTLIPAGEEDALEARRRLFYVAMTRAKRQLQMSCARTGEDGKPLTRSVFLEETGAPTELTPVPQASLLDIQALLLRESTPPPALPEPEVIEALLRDFSLSVTALNRYLRCPLAFYYEDLLKIPGVMSEAAAFGIAMHGALQQFLLSMKANKKMQFPSAEILIRLFGAEMERLRAHFSENTFKQRLALGKEYLRRIHVEQIPFWRKRAIVERRIDRVEFDGIPLTGVIDKIEWLDNGTIRLVDYKTGVPNLQKTAPPDATQPQGGDYWRQLAFYAILLDNARIYPEPVGKTAVSWLEPDKRGVFPQVEISFTATEIRLVETLIRDTWANIRAGRLHPGCGRADCPWCRLQQGDEIPETGFGILEEALDDGL